METDKIKELKYKCSECEKEFGQVFVVKEDGKIKQKCSECFYKKNE